MFDSKVVAGVAQRHRPLLSDLQLVEEALNQRFYHMEDAVRGLVLAVASGEPLLLVGPPGTGKSLLIRTFCGLLDLLNLEDLRERNESYFEYLLSPFTEPGELFGFYDLSAALNQKGLQRIETNMMQRATVVYLDEVFKGSSAILNSLLAFINEGFFHDRGERKRVAMKCLFASSNLLPEAAELRAVLDRFLLRVWVGNAGGEGADSLPADLTNLLKSGWRTTYSAQNGVRRFPHLLDGLEKFREDLKRSVAFEGKGPEFLKKLAQLIKDARENDLSEVSNRRLIKLVFIMLIHRIYRSVDHGAPGPSDYSFDLAELELFPKFFLDRRDEDTLNHWAATAEHWAREP